MDEEKEKEQQVAHEQQVAQEEVKPEDLEKKIQEANSPEEIMEIMEKLSKTIHLSKESTEKEIKKIKRKRILILAIEFALSFAVMLGVIGLFRPLVLQMKYGDLILIASVCLMQLIFTVAISLFKHPVVILLSDIIIDVIVALGIILMAHFMPIVKFNSEWDELSFIAVFLAAKTIIMTTLKRIMM